MSRRQTCALCVPRAGICACVCGDLVPKGIPREWDAGGLRSFLCFRTTGLDVMKKTGLKPCMLVSLLGFGLAGQFARSLGWLEACMPSCSEVRDSAKALRISDVCALAVEPRSSILVAVVASARGGISPASS